KILNASALVWYPAETDVSIRPGWFYHAKEDSKVKTPEKLLDIYFSSVGRNSVLLLNIPPDTRGRISDADSSSLLQWAKLRNRLFSKNLAAGARAKASNGSEGKNLFDGNIRSSFLVDQKDTTTSIEVELKSSQTFDVLLLQEDILKGQRVEKFRLEYQKGSEWLPVTRGTTIGYKRLLRFDPVTAQKLRLTIEASRLNPVLAEMGLYKLP
ncbi:MAG TPA: alpha-L-fucosidase, partial [Chitinophagaceae bacterium]|nr:alpha-L-fucosidase [Chitinophagaceae bacterium]